MDALRARIVTTFGAMHVDVDQLLVAVVENAAQMLRDRGCETVEGAGRGIGWIEECLATGEPVLVGGPAPSTRVFLSRDDRIAIRTVRATMEANDAAYDRTIFVSTHGATSFSKREAATTWGVTVQFFRYAELAMNITRHVLVPPHERCPHDHRHKAYQAASYPKLLASDPVALWYDFLPGELIKITRRAGATEPFTYFRLVA